MNFQNANMNLNTNIIPLQVITVTYPYQQLSFQDTLLGNSKVAYSKHKQGGCCFTCGIGIKGNIIFLIVMSVFTIAFSLAAKFTAFSTLDEYKYLKTIVSLEIEREERNNIAYSDNFRFNKFWYEFESFEDKIIIADMTCCGLLLTFLIIELIIYNTNLNKETKSGPLRGILILLNFLFYLCFYILFTFLIYAIIYSFLVIIMNPSYFSTASTYSQQESEWADKKYIRGFIHHGILWVLMIFTCILTSTDGTLFFLLEMYNEDDDNNVENNLDKIKSKTI